MLLLTYTFVDMMNNCNPSILEVLHCHFLSKAPPRMGYNISIPYIRTDVGRDLKIATLASRDHAGS